MSKRKARVRKRIVLLVAVPCLIATAAWTAFHREVAFDSKAEVKRILSTFGCLVKDDRLDEKTSTAAGSTMKEYDFTVVGNGSGFAVSNETLGNLSLSIQREWDMVRGVGRTGVKKWASEAQAKQYVLDRLRLLAVEQPGALNAWKYTLDSFNAQGQRVSGAIDATYGFTYSGHPMVDRFCGYKVVLDPQDGALASFRSGSRPPQFDSAFTPISEAAARARASSLGYRKTSLTEATAKLGWAVPDGATRATLAYYMKPRANDETSGLGYMIEAKQNGRHWSLGP